MLLLLLGLLLLLLARDTRGLPVLAPLLRCIYTRLIKLFLNTRFHEILINVFYAHQRFRLFCMAEVVGGMAAEATAAFSRLLQRTRLKWEV